MNIETLKRCAVILLGCLLAAVPGNAQSSASSSSDKQFLKSAGESALAALQFSSAVKDRTPKVAVRAYAENVIAQSHLMRQRLEHLASQAGVTLATDLNPQQRNGERQLNHTAPAQLDKQYSQLMVSQDEAAIHLFRQEVSSGADARVKEFARNTLPELQALLTQARQIEDASK
jgi:predicted outer membrane protein